MKVTYTDDCLYDILVDMVSYVQSCQEPTERMAYLKEIAQTGLFHDAIGKVVEINENEVVVVEEY